MTREEALALPAGPELDAIVHKLVMGLEPERIAIATSDGGKSACAWVDRRHGPWYSMEELALWLAEQKSRGLHLEYMIDEWQRCPKYSEEIAAAWMVAALLADDHQFAVEYDNYKAAPEWAAGWKYHTRYDGDEWDRDCFGRGDTPMLALCRAGIAAKWKD